MRLPQLTIMLAALVMAAPLAADTFPETVTYQGQALDAQGAPLSGDHTMTLRYFGIDDAELLSETLESVAVEDGRFTVELGTGRVEPGSAYDSLQAAFARHPEVRFELLVGETTYGPRVGILPAGHSLESRLVAAGVRQENDGKPHWRHYRSPSLGTAVQAAILSPATGSRTAAVEDVREGEFQSNPYLMPMVGPSLSPAVRDLPVVTEITPMVESGEVNPPRHEQLYDENGIRFGTIAPQQEDPLIGLAALETGDTPGLDVEFEGINNINGVYPPDPEGTVGPNHYVQVVNLSFAVYDKTGGLLAGPVNTNSLWAGFGGACETFNNGDAIFMYDQPADRFVFAQFAVSGGNIVCFAVSQTPDPTGAFFLYSVTTPRFPDYFKLGVWPDPANSAYFMGTNSGFQNAYDVFAVDRDNMLAGNPARPMQIFQTYRNLLMPADVDGPTGPPAGSPGLFYTFRDGGEPYFGNPPTDSIDIYEFDVDWTTPANSTFVLDQVITPAQGLTDFIWTVCGFFVQDCIPQPGTGVGLDSASWWPMQRLVYRNFGTHETLLGTWTVDVNPTETAPRRAGSSCAATRVPGRSTSRGPTPRTPSTAGCRRSPWTGPATSPSATAGATAATSPPSTTPPVWPATPWERCRPKRCWRRGPAPRPAPPIAGGTIPPWSSNPADDCTFWYTNEYLQITGGAPWRTRVGAFKIPECQSSLIFADGFESGDTSAWTTAVP